MRRELLSIQCLAGGLEGGRVLKLSGPLTLTTFLTFQDAWRAETCNLLVLDMTEVPFMDSAGLGSLVNVHVSCVNGGRCLALVGATRQVRSLLKTTRMESVFRTFVTLGEAEAVLAKPANA